MGAVLILIACGLSIGVEGSCGVRSHPTETDRCFDLPTAVGEFPRIEF